MDRAFSSLPLSPAMLANLAQLGYAEMTDIQAKSLPEVLAGRDLIAQASTGSGKTAAFAIGALHALNTTFFAPQTLVLCPTRELADQVAHEFRRLAKFAGNIKVVVLCGGGVSVRRQADTLEHGSHVIVGTPGRIADHLERGTLSLSRIRTLVLDEADRMLDMGFKDIINAIARECPERRQTLLFSATYEDNIRQVSARLLRDPVEVRVAALHDASTIEQHVFEVAPDARTRTVDTLLRHFRPESTLAFCNTKAACDVLAQALQDQGHDALALHGDMEQRDRDVVLTEFANGSCTVLVATDVAARGLDIKQLGAVINVEVSRDPEVHIHRIGRTGRNGEQGLALTLCTPREMHYIERIETYQGQRAQWADASRLSPKGGALRARYVTVAIQGGRKDKLRPGDVLGALTGPGGLTGEHVGRIHVFEHVSYAAVERGQAAAAVARMEGGSIKGRSLRARVVG
ncbi:ATP-dependent RNA helicase DbpA [Achromobacter sp. GG226]|uniref:ATP-dependent RNA helicase DbpA n=1 Tax=Verticiella alkaliphila TaxID=2779529 RepID=UPI001C0AD1EC|nr:ATP-dependent RNA helicase DbpA [Verticiella sp. GG226]MBU4610460.1 ATP-dependent RNA helicase DbpA [Verticiella sp. GG226]